MKFDVVVAGAGPAGCAAAYDLAASGRSVLLLDRRRFPRVKACAGGITAKTIKRLRYTIDPVVRQRCSEIQLGRVSAAHAVFRNTQPFCSMTIRAEFDEFCLAQTLAKGVAFQSPLTLHQIQESEGGVVIRTGAVDFNARYLIGADGVNSVVRKCLTGARPQKLGFAIEAQVYADSIPRMTFDFGAALDGYGWLFPKGDHVNVGLYTSSTRVMPGRAELEDYVRAKLGPSRLENVVGSYIGLGEGRQPLSTDRVILAGDAAGLVEPMLGEGIHNAVLSGQSAAAAIAEADATGESLMRTYARRLRALRAELRIFNNIATHFYRHIGLGYRLTTIFAQRGLLGAYAKGLTLSAYTTVPDAG